MKSWARNDGIETSPLEPKVGTIWEFFLYTKLGGGFKNLLFSQVPGEMIQFDFCIFFKWVGSTTN